jgi:hypothetical protein
MYDCAEQDLKPMFGKFKLLAKYLPRTQKNEWSKNWAVIAATKGAFLDFFCSVFYVGISKSKVLRSDRILVWIQVDPSGRAVWGEVLRSLSFWDCGFESSGEHGYLFFSLLNAVCFLAEVSVRRADHSSRRVLPRVACLSVIVKPC